MNEGKVRIDDLVVQPCSGSKGGVDTRMYLDQRDGRWSGLVPRGRMPHIRRRAGEVGGMGKTAGPLLRIAMGDQLCGLGWCKMKACQRVGRGTDGDSEHTYLFKSRGRGEVKRSVGGDRTRSPEGSAGSSTPKRLGSTEVKVRAAGIDGSCT